jgi:DNA-binding beta-propeller fold protein YncE
MYVNPSTGRICVIEAVTNDIKIYVIDGDAVTQIAVPGTRGEDSGLVSLAVNPTTNRVYVTFSNEDNPNDNTIDVDGEEMLQQKCL